MSRLKPIHVDIVTKQRCSALRSRRAVTVSSGTRSNPLSLDTYYIKLQPAAFAPKAVPLGGTHHYSTWQLYSAKDG